MMGLCFGSSVSREQQEAQRRSEIIDREIYEQAKKELNVLRILLLGASESGKSTLVKQMKVIHGQGFSQKELQSFKASARCILSCSRCFDENHQVIPSVSCALNRLWTDAGVRAATDRGREYELNDSAHYFFAHMLRILSPGFCPTVQDVLRVRVRTTGVLETHFQIRGLLFRVYDVGGLRTERSKWIRCFEDVNAVLFVVALNGYDTRLHKDDTKVHKDDTKMHPDSLVNRLQESMNLFASICNNLFFRNTSMILFLNKMDLFQQMILHSERHLRFYFPKYTGADCDVHCAAGYIASLFFGLNRSTTKCVYHHFTTATDTANMQVVFQFVMETIIKDNLQAVYLL